MISMREGMKRYGRVGLELLVLLLFIIREGISMFLLAAIWIWLNFRNLIINFDFLLPFIISIVNVVLSSLINSSIFIEVILFTQF
jgi:hypothetical protein